MIRPRLWAAALAGCLASTGPALQVGPLLAVAAIAAPDIAMAQRAKAGARHQKAARQAPHDRNRAQRNTKTVVVDRDVNIDVDDDDDRGGAFIGGLIVGGATAAIISEAVDD